MIRTVWLAIACLIGIAALTVIKVGTTSFEAVLPSDQTSGSSLAADASSSDDATSSTLSKADRLDVADEDAAKPIRAIAITTKAAAAAASEASSSEKSWRSSYAKRQAGVAKHRKGKLHKSSRRHRSYQASRSHKASKYMVVRKQNKQKKSRQR
jgi:hypothetical protein